MTSNLNTTYNVTYQYVQPYNFDIMNIPIFSVSILCSILSIIVSTYFLYKLFTKNRDESGSNSLLIFILSFVILCHLSLNVIDVIDYYTWYINYNFHSKVHWDLDIAWDIIWCLSQISIYILFVYRYYLVYIVVKHSLLYKYIIFGTYFILIIIQMILITVYMIYYYKFENHQFGTWQAEATQNNQRIYLDVLWAFLVIDLILTGSLSYLLLRLILSLIIDMEELRRYSIALLTTNTNTNTVVKDKKQTQLLDTVTRITITTIIAMISSFIYLFCNIVFMETKNEFLFWFQLTWGAAILINIICIYLSMGLAKNQYQIICKQICKCHQCCMYCFIKKIDSQIQQKYEMNQINKI